MNVQQEPIPAESPRRSPHAGDGGYGPYGGYIAGDQPRGLDIGGILGVLRRRWHVVAGMTGLFLVLALAAALFLPQKFDAEVRLKLDSSQGADVAASPMSLLRGDDQAIDTEIALIKSRSVADAVARRLNLPEVQASTNGEVPEKVIDFLLQDLTVEREQTTYIADLTFRAKDKQFAARAANAFAEEYLNISVSRRTGVAARQASVLDSRVKELGDEVQQAEAKVAQYRGSASIVQGSGQSTITDQQIGPITGQLAAADGMAAALRANVQTAHAQIARAGIETVPAVQNSPVVTDLRRQRSDLLREQAQIQERYGEKHPESIRINEQVAAVDRQIKEQASRIVSGIEADARAADASAASLRGQLGRLSGTQASNNRAAVTADSLQRDVDAKRAMYNQLALSAQQASQEEHSYEPKAMIIERAVPPLKPSWPKPILLAIVGLVGGVLSGVGLALLLDALAKGFQSVGELEKELGVPYIASLPMISKARLMTADQRELTIPEFVVDKPMSAYAEALRNVRGLLTIDRPGHGAVVAIGSAIADEGKTSTSAALARIMAMSGDRVIVVDCDLRQAGLSRIFPTKGKGLIEVLEGEIPYGDAIHKDETTGLDFLTLIEPTFTPRDIFAGAPFRSLISALRERYDYILLDTPPLLAVADARTLASLSGTVLMVVRWNHTPRRAAKAALARLAQKNVPILGTVLSMAKTTKDSADPDYYAKLYGQYQAS